MPARAHGLERRLEVEGTGRHQRAVLAEAVAHHHVRAHTVVLEQPGQREVGGEHRRLGDLGARQLALRLLDGGRVVPVDEDVRRERSPEQGRHDPVRLREGLGDHRNPVAQGLQHVDVLRSLAGVEEGHLGRRTTADEDTLRAQDLPRSGRSRAERLDRLGDLGREVRGVGVVDGHAHGRGRQRQVGGGAGRDPASGSLGGRRLELGDDIRVVAPAEHQRPAQRLWPPARGGGGADRGAHDAARDLGRGEGPRRMRRPVQAGDVLLEDGVEVRAAEAERADPGPPGAVRVGWPARAARCSPGTACAASRCSGWGHGSSGWARAASRGAASPS